MISSGIEVNTIDLTVSMSADRLYEIESLLHSWLHTRTTTKLALQSLVGNLVFVCKCVCQSRIVIARTLRLMRAAKFNHHYHLNLNEEFC